MDHLGACPRDEAEVATARRVGEAFTPLDHAFNLSLWTKLAQSVWLVLNRRTLVATFPLTNEPALVSAG
jgi:hypothetical protein